MDAPNPVPGSIDNLQDQADIPEFDGVKESDAASTQGEDIISQIHTHEEQDDKSSSQCDDYINIHEATSGETETIDSESENKAEFSQKPEDKLKPTGVDDMKVSLYEIDDVYDEEDNDRFLVPHDPDRLMPRVPKEAQGTDEYNKWVLVLRRVFTPTPRSLESTHLDIKSPLLLGVLSNVLKREKATLQAKASLEWPNDRLFQFRDKIREAAVAEGKQCVRHTGVLLDLIEEEYSTQIKDINKMLPGLTTSFDTLGEVFREGDLIIERDVQAYRVIDSEYDTEYYARKTFFIHAEYIDYDGKQFVAVGKSFEIQEFSGVQYFHDLPVFPLRYHTNPETAKSFTCRARKFLSLRGQHFRCYQEPTSKNSSAAAPRIMIDTAVINLLGRLTYAGGRSIAGRPITNELVNGELTNEHLMICTHQIPYFCLRTKMFLMGCVDFVQEIEFNPNVFDQLVIPKAGKEMIRVVIKSYAEGLDFDDFTQGKGKGLVMLLHGPPGVGKTMTAEAVAEVTKRPLYTVTSGELGSSSCEVEKRLKEILDIAEAFHAVVLLDEADVFMEKRSTHDIAHNALIAVFLRLLEYHKGIIILTTNRVKALDDAFHSRIHISLKYPSLGAVSREQIWRNFGSLVGGTELSDQDYAELATHDLNGRRIKNMVSLCQAVATDRRARITMEDVKMVLSLMENPVDGEVGI